MEAQATRLRQLPMIARGPGAARPAPAAPRARPAPARRYLIADTPAGRVLRCAEAPTLAVRVERDLSFTAAEARGHPPGAIFVDGAALGAPFADPARGVYNLDHHEGCVRAFTLSACEQAMVLLGRSLDLAGRDFTVYANDADLDAVLAIWVLLNHQRLRDPDSPARAEIMPLLRLQGAIDAHGFELQDLCALPPALLDETRRRMDRLRDRELALRSAGQWKRVDLLEHVRERLEQIDAFAYPPDAFADLVEIEELGRVPIGRDAVAVACRARVGIHEVARQLARFHGRRLGLVVLRQQEGRYTLRQVDPGLGATLDGVYAHLNQLDPAVAGPRSADRWGGSDEIGGSPRDAGSRLSCEEILAACRAAFEPPRARDLALELARTTVAAAAMLIAALGAFAAAPTLLGAAPAIAFGIVLAGVALPCTLLGGRGARRLHGWRRPAGLAWLAALPFALAGATLGGVWLPAVPEPATAPAISILAALLLPIGAELVFRGFVHGRVLRRRPVRRGAESFGAAALASALLYGAATAVLAALPAVLASAYAGLPPIARVGGALLFGLAAGAARERSGSLLPPVLLHAAGIAIAWSLAGIEIGA
jgi:membrane protease YdiL (CAAX protease family)